MLYALVRILIDSCFSSRSFSTFEYAIPIAFTALTSQLAYEIISDFNRTRTTNQEKFQFS